MGGEYREPASRAGERPLRPGRGPGGTVARDPSVDAVSAAHRPPQDAGIAHDHSALSAARPPVAVRRDSGEAGSGASPLPGERPGRPAAVVSA
ncbi:MAG: hypothetical protein FWJ90_09700 [Actinomadura sp.]